MDNKQPNEKMHARAVFHRKEPCLETQECEIEKVITLSDVEFDQFQKCLLNDYDFLHDNAELMRVEDGVTHCLLVMGTNSQDGILVNSEGSSYARYSAYFPNAKSFLLTQGQTQQMVQAETPVEAASPSAVGGSSAALLAYAERMNHLVDMAICQALECHDQSTYIISLEAMAEANDDGSFDTALFTAMLKERTEIVDMDISDGDILVTLSPESIQAHELSKLKVLTQDDLNIMQAKHTLWVYDQGGEQANFSGCRLSGLDMSRMQLNGADFTGALLERVNMSSSGVCSCVFQDARFVGCSMTGICAEEADFRGAVFEECNVKRGVFTHSNFAHTQFHDTDLWMADMRLCCMEGSNIMDMETEGVKLSGTSDDEESWANDTGISAGMGGIG